MAFTPRVFSGIQPSGDLHLGNYLGAIRRFVPLQKTHECIYCVVDMHAITVWQEPEDLRRRTYEVAAAYIAAGLDPARSVIFNQSQVAGHAELAWVFNCVARLGWMARMTQFKDKAGKNSENVSLGLFAYPSLMAADILLYHATHVPVGDDQKQHLELTRDIAAKFNNDYAASIAAAGLAAEFFPITEPVIDYEPPVQPVTSAPLCPAPTAFHRHTPRALRLVPPPVEQRPQDGAGQFAETALRRVLEVIDRRISQAIVDELSIEEALQEASKEIQAILEAGEYNVTPLE